MKSALITFLGTGIGNRTGESKDKYMVTRYKMPDGTVFDATPFIGLALNSYVKPDDIHILGTVNSMWPTLVEYLQDENPSFEIDEALHENIYDTYGDPSFGNYLDETGEYLSRLLKQKGQVKLHLHGYLDDQNKMLLFLNELTNIFKQFDTIYLDITHGFRHIPVITMTALSYITALQPNLNIAGIWYASFESKKSTTNTNEPARVIDLLPAWDMIEWFHAARDFVRFGNAADLVPIIKPINNELSNVIKGIYDTLNLTFIEGLGDRMRRLDRSLNTTEVKEDARLKPLIPFIDDIRKYINTQSEEWENQIRISIWYYEHKMFQQALTSLTEGIKTMTMTQSGFDWKNREDRTGFSKDYFTPKKQRELLDRDLFKIFKTSQKLRNDVNHAGMVLKNASSMTKSSLDAIHRLFANLKKWIENNQN